MSNATFIWVPYKRFLAPLTLNPQENHTFNPQAEQPQGFVNQSSTLRSKSIIFATGEIHFIKSF